MQLRGLVQSMTQYHPSHTRMTCQCTHTSGQAVQLLGLSHAGSWQCCWSNRPRPTKKVAAGDDAYTAGRCLLPRTWSLQFPKGVHQCHAKHVALALKLLPTFYDLKSNECRTSLLYSRKFSSANNFVKSDRQAVRQEFIFVKCRSSLVCSSIVWSLLFCLSFIFPFMKAFLTQHLRLLKKLVRNLI